VSAERRELERDPAKALESLVRQIVDVVHPLEIILFGSAARGEVRADSDIDVMVVMPDGTPRTGTARTLYRRIRGIGIPYDIVVATPSLLERHRDTPGLVYGDALREGRTLYAA
jgi:predicted nucleotidyltransferase